MKLPHLLALVLVPAGWLVLGGDARVLRAPDPPVASPPLKGTEANSSAYQKDVLPFLKRHCFTCHGNGKARAELSFDRYSDDASVLAQRKVWDNVRHMLKAREMPPKEKPQP